MGRIILGVGDYGASKAPDDVIKTFALGSCVAVTLYDARLRVAGMVHVVLPDSTKSGDKAKEMPGYFADTGIEALLVKMAALGCSLKGRGLTIKAAGGAKMLELSGALDIGKRNAVAVRKVLWQRGLGLAAEDVGGSKSRTVEMDVSTGEVRIIGPSGDTSKL